jgi:ribonuclease BN (tRNA processing enzyme)
MKLTVLGNNGPFPSAGGACSGYLITEGDKNILIDCGNGVLANLQRFIPIEELDAIILTHLHSDHMSDMMILRYALQIKMNRGAKTNYTLNTLTEALHRLYPLLHLQLRSPLIKHQNTFEWTPL